MIDLMSIARTEAFATTRRARASASTATTALIAQSPINTLSTNTGTVCTTLGYKQWRYSLVVSGPQGLRGRGMYLGAQSSWAIIVACCEGNETKICTSDKISFITLNSSI